MATLLLWLDMEMTGLEPARDRILELATIVTDAELRRGRRRPRAGRPPARRGAGGDGRWNTEHHGASGLTERARASTVTEADAEAQTLAFVDAHFPAKDRPVLCGNSIHQDRRFIRRYLPAFDVRLHYRMIDVSTVKELGRRWYPAALAAQPPKTERHRALDDIRESIAELRCSDTRDTTPGRARERLLAEPDLDRRPGARRRGLDDPSRPVGQHHVDGDRHRAAGGRGRQRQRRHAAVAVLPRQHPITDRQRHVDRADLRAQRPRIDRPAHRAAVVALLAKHQHRDGGDRGGDHHPTADATKRQHGAGCSLCPAGCHCARGPRYDGRG
jgi:oligoribonuclease